MKDDIVIFSVDPGSGHVSDKRRNYISFVLMKKTKIRQWLTETTPTITSSTTTTNTTEQQQNNRYSIDTRAIDQRLFVSTRIETITTPTTEKSGL